MRHLGVSDRSGAPPRTSAKSSYAFLLPTDSKGDHMTRRRLASSIVVALLAVIAAAAPAGAATNSLAFASPTSLTLAPAGTAHTATAMVTLRNEGQAVTDLRFVAIPRGGGVSVTVVRGGTTVSAFSVKVNRSGTGLPQNPKA